MGGAATITIQYGTTFYSDDLEITAGNVLLNGGNFKGELSYFKRTAGGTCRCEGGNVFDKKACIVYTNTGEYSIGAGASTVPDIYNGDLTLVNTSTGKLMISYNTVNNEVRGNLYVNSAGAGSISIGLASGSSTLFSSGSAIIPGVASGNPFGITNPGMAAGSLNLNTAKFQKTDPFSIEFPLNYTDDLGATVTSTATLAMAGGTTQLPGTVFNSNLSVIAPGIVFTGTFKETAFPGVCSFRKTGSTVSETDATVSVTFAQAVTFIVDAGAFNFVKTSTTFAFNGDVYFVHNGGSFLSSMQASSTLDFKKNLNYQAGASITPNMLGNVGGKCRFSGKEAQQIVSNKPLTINKLIVDKTPDVGQPQKHLELLTPVSVLVSNLAGLSPELTLTRGNIVTTTTNILTLGNGGTLTAAGPGSALSFIDGPFRRTGISDFTFPVGKGTVYAPITISAISASSTIEAQYFSQGQTVNANLAASVKDISDKEYWSLINKNSTTVATIKPTLLWSVGGNPTAINPDVVSIGYTTGAPWAGMLGTVTIASPLNSILGNSSLSLAANSATTTYLTFGYRTKLILDTRYVNGTSFTLSGNTEPLTDTYISGSGGTNGGLLTCHPSFSSPVDIAINYGSNNSSYNLHILTDANGDPASVYPQSSADPLAPELYAISSDKRTVTFYKSKQPVLPANNISTNLINGLLFKRSTGLFTVNATGYKNVTLEVSDKAGTVVYPSNSILSWDGKIGGVNAANGVYVYKVSFNGQLFSGQLMLED